VPPARRLLAEQEQAGHVAAAAGGGYTYLALNVHHGPFSNVSVRRAANLAVDRGRIANAFYPATSRPWAAYLPSTLATSATQPYPLHADIAAARRQLERSGLRLPIPISLWYFSPKSEIAPAVAEVKRDLDAAGFAVSLRPIWGPWFGAERATEQQEADMQFAGWGEDYPDADTVIPFLFRTGADYNYLGYSSQLVDREIRRLEQSPDTQGRRAAWSALADHIARRDSPIVVLGDLETARLHSGRVRNVVISAAKTGPDLSLIDLGD
jgi:ABC-type transport system substrate-binding protein